MCVCVWWCEGGGVCVCVCVVVLGGGGVNVCMHIIKLCNNLKSVKNAGS